MHPVSLTSLLHACEASTHAAQLAKRLSHCSMSRLDQHNPCLHFILLQFCTVMLPETIVCQQPCSLVEMTAHIQSSTWTDRLC